MNLPADHTLMAQGRLVAYVWKSNAGALQRASQHQRTPLLELAWAEVHVYDPRWEAQLAALAGEATDLEAYLFSCGVAGLDVLAGEHKPAAFNRRF